MKITWHDAGRDPKCAPNPDYPNGIDIDASIGAAVTCSAKLPYPAKRCGQFFVSCPICKTNIVITTAGRPDDPRSVKLACKMPASKH